MIQLTYLFVPDAVSSPKAGHVSSSPGDGLFNDLTLLSLEKQLNIEQKVRYMCVYRAQ